MLSCFGLTLAYHLSPSCQCCVLLQFAGWVWQLLKRVPPLVALAALKVFVFVAPLHGAVGVGGG